MVATIGRINDDKSGEARAAPATVVLAILARILLELNSMEYGLFVVVVVVTSIISFSQR